MKIGIYGGSFNPPHMGHLEAVQTVKQKLGLDQVLIIPTFQNPLKVKIEGPTPEQRLKMTELAFSGYGQHYKVLDTEIKRGETSYTIDTINELKKSNKDADYYLILGADHIESFHLWKSYKQILNEVHLVITTRPGFDLPSSQDELPAFLNELVAEYDFNFVELKNGKSVQFLRINDLEISSSEIRKMLRSGKQVERLLPLFVESYIKIEHLYQVSKNKISDYHQFTKFCADFLNSKKAISVRTFDLRGATSLTDYNIVASGTSTRHASSLAENLVLAVKSEFRLYPLSVEGLEEGRWVVVDYGFLIIHVFYDFVRHEYNLESIWKNEIKFDHK